MLKHCHVIDLLLYVCFLYTAVAIFSYYVRLAKVCQPNFISGKPVVALVLVGFRQVTS